MHYHSHNPALVVLSVVIAIFASYTALDFALNINFSRNKGRRWPWLLIGSVAMGIGIWSMHFIGMLAFHLPNVDIFYDIKLLVLSILVSIAASFLSLHVVSKKQVGVRDFILASLAMGAAITGMHYIGIWSMIMPVKIVWNYSYVSFSILVSIVSSCVALLLAFKLKDDYSIRAIINRIAGATVMGLAISSMHYIAMAAMSFEPLSIEVVKTDSILASEGLAAMVIVCTLLILGIALITANIDRTLTKKDILNEALSQAIFKRDEFFSVASHELKTPLTSLKLQVQMVLKKMQDPSLNDARVRTLLEQADMSLNRITLVVDDMLDIARLSTGKLSLQFESCSLQKIILDVIERMTPLAEGSGNKFQFESSEEFVGNWDKFRLEQVLINLFSNAIRYAPGSQICIKLWNDKNQVKISVRDFGRGIAKEDFNAIFERYERGKATSDERGLGLGLYIVKQMVNLHGGDVFVESELGQGSNFVVSLPRKETSAQ